MKNSALKRLAFVVAMISCFDMAMAQGIELVRISEITLSAIAETTSKTGQLLYTNTSKQGQKLELKISGPQADLFSVSPGAPELEANESVVIQVHFNPVDGFIGIAQASLSLLHGNMFMVNVPLRGLSTRALEGENEAPLSDILKVLGYKINLGWTTLANHLKPDLQGDEIPQQLFRKAANGPVEIIPLARYSPPWSLPFGYYYQAGGEPERSEVGVMSGTTGYPEHQTLHPGVEKGTTSFDPGDEPFGIFTTSPTHVAYSQDKWNALLHKDHAAHACRVYEARNSSGELIPDQYLVCFEEASNGDYQDYVFLLKNATASLE